jgi:hypothetical protein
MQKEDLYISTWRNVAEQSLGWGESAGWSDNDFEKLSELILAKTGTMLSITTLKRLWGRVRYDSTPNAATLNVLARFIDFNDWRSFKQSIDTAQQSSADEPPLNSSHRKPYLPILLAAVAITIALAILIAWNAKPKAQKTTVINAPVKFKSRQVTDGLPNSVVFDYDASALHTDSVVLQQSWDPSRIEKIAANGKQHTSIYYYPGYFTAKLIANGQVKKESPVFIKSKGWVGIIEKKPVPTYLSATDIHLPGALGVTGKTLAHKTGSPVFNNQVVSFSNVQEFGNINGGDFTFETTLRNTSTPEESSCRKAAIYILGKQNAIIIPLAARGCISDLYMYTSSEWINGKEKDMSAFGCDFEHFQHFTCSVKDMKLSITLNNKPIFAAPITQTIGDIIGISIGFEGAGEIKNVKLANKTRRVLQDDFAN